MLLSPFQVVERGKTALAEICVDGCDVVSKNSGSEVGFEQLLTKWSTCHELSPARAAIFLRMLSDRIYTAAVLVDTRSELG